MLFSLLLINVCAAADSGSTAPSVELTSVDYSATSTSDNKGMVVGESLFRRNRAHESNVLFKTSFKSASNLLHRSEIEQKTMRMFK
ncbi:unnamed protein product [Strongylus vulgaris]|uniref:Uncharacterized protein n=1 Tax=Strongylus vulgaris TaxID=40348 RepID=A0A3P7IBJ0_STRVU|nr:unnamed protein product [Strongylus vulgaris]